MKCNLKKLDYTDMALVKLASAAMVLFIIRIWPAAMAWVHSVNAWWFLVAAVVLAIKPAMRCCKK